MICVKDLFFRYPGKRHDLLRGIELKIKKGSITGLIGINGSGKTTLFQILLGILRAEQGLIEIAGYPLAKLPKELVGFLPERPYYHGNFTLKEYLYYLGKISSRQVKGEELEQIIASVDLAGYCNQYIRSFSKGMLQRVGLAQTLLHQPDLIIMDEITSGLDPIGQNQLKEIILRIKQSGTTVLISSHHLAQIEQICDQICLLHNGKTRTLTQEYFKIKNRYQLILEGKEEELKEKLQHLSSHEQLVLNKNRLTFEFSNAQEYFDILSYLLKAKIKIINMQANYATLEEIVLKYLAEEGDG